MAELVLPGVYIEVRGEALIVPGPISVGNIGIVGTARQGPIGEVQLLSSFNEARDIFGAYDDFANPEIANTPVTLVRALEQAYANGASTVYAVRVTSTAAGVPGDQFFIEAWGRNTTARRASADIAAEGGGGPVATLRAKGTAGTSGNNITYEVIADPTDATRAIVTVRSGSIAEEYNVDSGTDLVDQITANSTLVDAEPGTVTQAAIDPAATLGSVTLQPGISGANASGADYKRGLDQLLNEDAHIIVAAGQPDTELGDELKSHVESASTDKIKRDRIAVVGSRAKGAAEDVSAFLTAVSNPNAVGDRVIFVTPGIKTTDSTSGNDVILPGAYSAAAVAGMLSARSPHISLTNKSLSVGGLEVKFTSGQLEQLVKSNVLALEARRGFRIVKGITTDDGAFRQITTRRIVDFAKAGVRSASEPYIGLLNNQRVRQALKGSINGFLASMIDDEMLVSYELDVTATRDEEIRGIAKVTMTVRPTFSLDYIKVVMYLG